MKGQSPRFSADMWSKLALIGEKKGSIKLSDLAAELGLGTEDTLVFLRQVFPAEQGAQVYHKDDICMVDLDAAALQYMLPLTPAEWMKLNELLTLAAHAEPRGDTALASLRRKVAQTGPVRIVMELMQQLQAWDFGLTEAQSELVRQLDAAVEAKALVRITTTGSRALTLFPCRVLHLEGQLALVGEDGQDHCLVVVPVAELSELQDLRASSKPRVTAFEVEEFIAAVRAMNERETRLILKIHDPQAVNLFPEHHFLGKPCMLTNPEGDLIWAAYVEPCDDLYEWMLSLGDHVEILDPQRFRDEFLAYCGVKVRKIA